MKQFKYDFFVLLLSYNTKIKTFIFFNLKMKKIDWKKNVKKNTEKIRQIKKKSLKFKETTFE